MSRTRVRAHRTCADGSGLGCLCRAHLWVNGWDQHAQLLDQVVDPVAPVLQAGAAPD